MSKTGINSKAFSINLYNITPRSRGRIVEVLIDDFVALVTSGMLTVVVQNTGSVTADYSVSIALVITQLDEFRYQLMTVPKVLYKFHRELKLLIHVSRSPLDLRYPHH